MKDITKEWLKSAKDDLNVISKINLDPALTNMIAFHAQQSIEKALKAIIEEFDMGLTKIHNLNKLFEDAKKHLNFSIDDKLVEKLDKLYIDARYPGYQGLLPNGKPTLKDAQDFIIFAKTVFEKIETILKNS